MTDRLTSGQGLQVDESLASPNGQFSLVLQPDGNLVLSEAGQPVWATGTDGQQVSSATLQEDGNFVLYSPTNDPLWATDTYGNNGASLVLQDDRNLVIYSADGNPIWASQTSA